jgi:hypothetical protein
MGTLQFLLAAATLEPVTSALRQPGSRSYTLPLEIALCCFGLSHGTQPWNRMTCLWF